MKMLRIVACKSPLMWYANKVGDLVPYCGRWQEAYKSLEPAGYLNRVEFEDAQVVELAPDGTITVLAETQTQMTNDQGQMTTL